VTQDPINCDALRAPAGAQHAAGALESAQGGTGDGLALSARRRRWEPGAGPYANSPRGGRGLAGAAGTQAGAGRAEGRRWQVRGAGEGARVPALAGRSAPRRLIPGDASALGPAGPRLPAVLLE
jgi:hypothetical protein